MPDAGGQQQLFAASGPSLRAVSKTTQDRLPPALLPEGKVGVVYVVSGVGVLERQPLWYTSQFPPLLAINSSTVHFVH